jgi:sulfur carrier protein ThiS adenylyltransferase
MIKILVNEHSKSIPANTTVRKLRGQEKPDADVIVVNGYPCIEDYILKEGDQVVLIRKGEIPQMAELEALMVARHSPGVHERVKRATVGIAGLGGLGSAVSIALARMGLGTLILVDFDVVEPSNLNRQQFFIDQIGMPKTQALSKILASINPFIKIVIHKIELNRKNIPKVFNTANVVVECFDRADEKVMILESVAESLPKAYVVGASGLAGYGDSNSIKTWRLGNRVFIVGDMVKAAGPGLGLMAPRVGIAAHHQANLVVSLLVDSDEAISKIPDMMG